MIKHCVRTIGRMSAVISMMLAVGAAPWAAGQALAQANPKELVIAMPANINTLDPHQTATVETDLSVISHLYQPLVIRGSDMKIKPVVAKSWKPVNDTTWEFDLVPGITFPNGEKLDAAAVKWNIERVLDPKTAARIKAWFDPIKEVRVVSPTKLQIVTKEPYPALIDQMSMFFLLPPKWASENNPSRAALGSGPYDLKQFVSGDRIVLEAKKSYQGADKPTFERVVIRPIPEEASRVAAVMAGEVDMASGILPTEIARINASGKARAAWLPGTRMMFVKFNTMKPPLKDNVKLRQAINYAIDKQAIIKSVLADTAKPSQCQVLTPDYFGYNADLKAYPYDPAKARGLVAQSGYNPSQVLEFEVPLGRYQQSQEIGQAIAAQLEDIGIKTKLVEMEFGSWLNKYRKLGNLGTLAYMGQGWPTLDADGFLTLFEPGNEYAYWADPQFGALIKEARATVDPAKRQALYKQATDTMCREAPVAFLWAQPFTYVLSNRIDWKPRGDEWIRATDMRLR